MIDYDSSAFSYFIFSCLTLYLIPATLYILWRCYDSYFGQINPKKKARTQAEFKKYCDMANRESFSSRFCYKGVILQILISVIILLLLHNAYKDIQKNGPSDIFDPYEILNIKSGTKLSDIKKAYRKLSLKYHPDKSTGNKGKFIKIQKAYEALTDEEGRRNYEETGNPDGFIDFKISIGLPSWLLEPENKLKVLYIYGAFMVILIPLISYYFYNQTRYYSGDDNIYMETTKLYHKNIKEDTNKNILIDLLCLSDEFTETELLKRKENEIKHLKELYTMMKKKRQMIKPSLVDADQLESLNKKQYRYIKANILLHAYLNRLYNELTYDDISNIINMLPICTKLVSHMFECVVDINPFTEIMEFGKVEHILHLSQMLYQGIYSENEPFIQLPNISNEEIAKIRSKCDLFKDFVKQPFENFEELINKDNRKDIKTVTSFFPFMEVTVKCTVADEDTIVTRDLVTVNVHCKRLNIRPKDKIPECYSNYYYGDIQEKWYFMLVAPVVNRVTMKQSIVVSSYETSVSKEREFTVKLHFQAPDRPGSDMYSVNLYAFCNCYQGLDIHIPVEFDVKRPDEIKIQDYTEEDKEVINDDSTFISKIIDGVKELDDDKLSSDSEDYSYKSDNEEDDIVRKEKMMKKNK